MTNRYVLSDYEKEEDETPRSNSTFCNLQKAEESFTNSAKRKIKSTVLYDTKEGEVLKLAINGPPIYLVLAIEKARGDIGGIIGEVKERYDESTTGTAMTIDYIAKALAGEPIPGISNVVMAHFLAPYYASKGDAVETVRYAAGAYGGLSGAVIGTIVGGPAGAVIGSAVGAGLVGKGAADIVKASLPPSPKCKICNGTGLVNDYRRCRTCDGYGYKK